MAINKVIYGSTTLIDLTADTVTADKLLTGFTAHSQSGKQITGTCDFDVNSQDATVQVAEILTGKTAYARGTMLTGTMPNRGAVTGAITDKDTPYSISQGYHDGSGTVAIDSTEAAKIIPANIKNGISILGVTGTLEPSSEVTAHAKSVVPGVLQQTVLPDEEYDYLTQVTVAAIPYAESENAAGGTTVTIAGA